MIEKNPFEAYLDDYVLATVNVAAAKEFSRAQPADLFAATWAKAVKAREEYASLCYERLLCYVYSSGAETPTIQELRDARETQGVPV